MEKTPPFVETWLEHQHRDAYWEQGSVCEDYSAIRIPVLTMSGWADGYTDAVFRLMDNLDVPKRAVIGPWAHEFPDLAIPGPQIWPSVSVAELEVDLDHSQILVPQSTEPVFTELPFPQAETAKPLDKTILREGSRTRKVIKSLTTHEWVLDDFSDEGLRLLNHNGITYGTKNHNIWRIRENDPLSAVTESNWEVDLSDADISIHVETQSRLSCDADNFYLVNSMQAYEEGKEVFRNTWEKTIPRRFC